MHGASMRSLHSNRVPCVLCSPTSGSCGRPCGGSDGRGIRAAYPALVNPISITQAGRAVRHRDEACRALPGRDAHRQHEQNESVVNQCNVAHNLEQPHGDGHSLSYSARRCPPGSPRTTRRRSCDGARRCVHPGPLGSPRAQVVPGAGRGAVVAVFEVEVRSGTQNQARGVRGAVAHCGWDRRRCVTK